uniref:Exodeoxyribonuclease V subunit gamma n=1 Tax=Janibacter limosus TaxID=53458 RepID=A0AC61U3M8_9MICO|nr:exodeoxyribonuclease V subunit gamma [Janibacter limosus]
MALHLHRAQRTDTLADELGELLSSPLPDPFAQEVVVVPEQGIERWLAQRLSHRLGTGEGGTTGCAPASPSCAPAPSSRCSPAATTTTRGCRSTSSGRSSRSSTPRSGSRGASR